MSNAKKYSTTQLHKKIKKYYPVKSFQFNLEPEA